MKKDITHWCNECLSCQASKIQRHYRAPVEAIPVPPRRFTHVHVDIVGPIANIQRVHVSPDDPGPHHPMAGSCSPSRHHSCKLRTRIYDRMGRALRVSITNDL